MKRLKIGPREIGDVKPVFVIAEVGSNHNRHLKTAKQLIDVAVRAGADAVKFQTFRGDYLYSRFTPSPPLGTPFYKFFRNKTVPEAFRQWELPWKWHSILAAYARKKGIIFMSTPFDLEAADLLYSLKVPAFKIASYELNNIPLIRHVAQFHKPMILSTGGADLGRIRDALDICKRANNQQVVLLHCISEYPAPYEHMNVKAIETLRRVFRVPVGLSDHSEGNLAAIMAVSMGAVAVEKHITLSRRLPGPDHAFAMEPKAFYQFVRDIHNTTRALGTGKKQPTAVEKADAAGGSIVARMKIPVGAIISESMLTVKRPARGLSPRLWDRVLGKIARRDILEDMWLSVKDIQWR